MAQSGNTNITRTVMSALMHAIPTPSQSPHGLRWRISTPVSSCTKPTISQNQPQAVRSIP